MPCAAALATLKVLETEDLAGNAARVGEYFKEALSRLAQGKSLITEVRGTGLMLALQLSEGRAADIAQSALERGFVINNIGADILRFLPPLLVTTDEVDSLLEVLEEIL